MATAAAVCLKLHIPFVLYRFPGKECCFFSNPSGITNSTASRQFGIAMWNSLYADRIIIADEMNATQTLNMKPEWATGTIMARTAITPWPHTTERKEYEVRLRRLIDELKQRGGKTVISRVVSEKKQYDSGKWVKIADRVFESNLSAMCCLYYTPQTGGWICASPELLLEADFTHRTLHTIALAGTRRRSENIAQEWSEKDLMEHEVVKQFLLKKLTATNTEIEVSPTETCRSGEIEHLRTFFTAKMSTGFQPAHFLDTVSPTPALCGYPTDIAKENIKEIEAHPRYCYGGYFMVESAEQAIAYVNIRCVHFDEDRMTLYAGSGIMPDSTPAGEWDETEAKLSAIGNNL